MGTVLKKMIVKSIVADIHVDRLSDLYDLNLITESTVRQINIPPAQPGVARQQGETTNEGMNKLTKFFKNLSIPDYLFQSSNTYFRKASSKERIVNMQMTINSKKKLEQKKDNLETQRSRFRGSFVVGDHKQLEERANKLQISPFSKTNVRELEQIQEESLEEDLERKAQKFHVEAQKKYKDTRKVHPQLFRSFQQTKEKSENLGAGKFKRSDGIKITKLPLQSTHFIPSFKEEQKPEPSGKESGSQIQNELESPGKESSGFEFEGSSAVNPNDLKYISMQALTSESKMCTVCFDKNSDSVYMPCGHGGLCFSCAIEI